MEHKRRQPFSYRNSFSQTFSQISAKAANLSFPDGLPLLPDRPASDLFRRLLQSHWRFCHYAGSTENPKYRTALL
jgi:hypothetical protein